MGVLARAGLRLVFWLSVGLAVLAVAAACLGSYLSREARVQTARLRAHRHHRTAARAGSVVGEARAPAVPAARCGSAGMLGAWRDDSSTR